MNALVRYRRRRAEGEGGFALLAVLGVIALTSLTTVALLGLVLTTLRVTAMHEQMARDTRAADGGIEAAMQMMRNAPCPVSAVEPNPVYLSGLGFDQGNGAGSDDVSATVRCATAGGTMGSTDQVRLVGADGYQGKVRYSTNCVGALVVPACFPWSSSAGSVPSDLTSSAPTLVHSGPQPLQFASGLTVRRGAAVLGNPSLATPASATPALKVGGQYAQGEKGLGGAGANDCGLLAGTSGNGAGLVVDMDTMPSCGDASARGVDDSPTDAISGVVASTATPVVPACSGSVIKVQAATFDSVATAKLNTLMATCTGRTYWFAPGVYSFDGTSLTFADPSSYYVFGQPNGWPTGAGVGAVSSLVSDPNSTLCDPERSGTTLVLSARTTIVHTAGRVAVCPAFPPTATTAADAYPAIYQTTTVPTEVKLTGTPALPVDRLFKCDPFYDSTYSAAYSYIDPYDNTCPTTQLWDFRIDAAGTDKVTSLKVMLTGSEGDQTQNNFVNQRWTAFQLRTAAGATVCTTNDINGTPNGGMTTAYEVVNGGCAAALQAMSIVDLQGMTLRVFQTLRLQPIFFPWWAQQWLTLTRISAQVNAITASVDTAKVTSATSNWTGMSNIGTAGSLAEPVMPCDQAACKLTIAGTAAPDDPGSWYRHELDIGAFTFAGVPTFASGIDPNVTSLRLLVDLATGQRALPTFLNDIGFQTNNYRVDMITTLELTTSTGVRCTVDGGSVNGGAANANQQLAFDLMSIDNLRTGSGCEAIVEHFSELNGKVKAKIVFNMPCARNPAVLWECFHEFVLWPNTPDVHTIWQVRPPSVDRVSLAMTLNSYHGPPPTSTVTIDAKGAGGSSFTVYGKTWMPLSDLDIHWKGAVTAAPLFRNDLVLHGLGSDMTPTANAGVVCCSPPDSRTVELTSTAGHSTVTATVEYHDVVVDPVTHVRTYSPGQSIDILGWGRCAGTCASVLGVSQINSGS